MRFRTAILAAIISFGFTAVVAQDIQPLSKMNSSKYEETYPLVRCAGFYLANVEWSGQIIEEPIFQELQLTIRTLVAVAALQRNSRANSSLEHQINTAEMDMRTIADIYLSNYRQSYALTGSAWSENPIWNGDAATCKNIAETAFAYKAVLQGANDQ
ncbi:hypothetical protein [Parasulfitobacter algicola]|uniref:Uncharacterized protein n=1 Tax=Parasulfitobacter algicola TaxID=2614809 RepID=A0ABX2IYZ4_9RHOB|nr:hypothetical protein [Sulfitobacter algicola]NSX56422.1 hypothetical protein [Sulfitobacter algicola]